MFVYIVGGFLGSGKTTLLMKIASMYLEMGKKVTILVNEMGEIGVDGATFKSEGYNSVELPNGCICCSLSGTLQSAMKSIKNDINPDVILVEPTGLALPHKVKELIHTSMINPDLMEIIGVIDGVRFNSFLEKKKNFFIMQIKHSDLILINKTDLLTPEQVESVIQWTHNEFHGPAVIPVSGKTGEGLEKAFSGLYR